MVPEKSSADRPGPGGRVDVHNTGPDPAHAIVPRPSDGPKATSVRPVTSDHRGGNG